MKSGWAFAVRWQAAAVGLVACAWLTACAPAVPTLPSKGGPTWYELTSEHFRLWTDDSVERGRKLVTDLERRREVIASAMGRTDSRGMAFVISVRSTRERAVYLPLDFVGVAWAPQNPTGQPGILLSADYNDRDHVVSHELAHVVSQGFFANLPPWLSEGIATYFEMVDVDTDDTRVKIGIPRSDRADVLRERLTLSVSELFACNADSCKDGTFYAASWAMFTLLLNEHYDQLAHYLQRLNQLRPDAPPTHWDGEASVLAPEQLAREQKARRERWQRGQAEAWHDAFPDLSPEKLDTELTEWLRTGKLRLPRIDVAVRVFPAAVRVLGDADVLAARSWLRYRYTNDDAATLRDAEAALALDRTNVLARIVATTLTHAIAADDARATVAAHPDDWRALRLTERALHGTPEADHAHDRLCALAANTAPECTPRDGQPGTATATGAAAR